VLADRKGTITNDLAAAEELKQKAVAAKKPPITTRWPMRGPKRQDRRQAKAEIQKDLDAATAKADAEIAAKAAESEKTIAGIRDGAAAAVAEVARTWPPNLVGASGAGRMRRRSRLLTHG
jgi:F-type H+-transporting ATPase subunit b